MSGIRQVMVPPTGLERGGHSPGYASIAVRGGSFLWVSGLTAFDVRSGKPVRGSTAEETEAVLLALKRILQDSGSSLDRIVKVNVLLASMLEAANFEAVYLRHISEPPPARTLCGARLPDGARVMVECTALA
jgi:2-iminobutanoate/2-iminopropanoate deaminase